MILSAFGSAGQRCSALRVLYAPKDSADSLIEGLKGALAAQVLGDPSDPASDIGPVIDTESRQALEAHVQRLQKDAKIVARAMMPEGSDRGDLFDPVHHRGRGAPVQYDDGRRVLGHELPSEWAGSGRRVVAGRAVRYRGLTR